MPRSLEPNQIALPTALARGALVSLPDPRAKDQTSYEALRFQYNPETVTRARTGQWERKLEKKGPDDKQIKAEQDASRGGALKAKSEIISFKLVFDAAEYLLRAGAAAADRKTGILPELAILERMALGPDQMPDPPKKDNEFELFQLQPSEVLLILGPRTFPGVVTQMNIVEQRFSTDLAPIRAEIDLRFRVLETTTVAAAKATATAFTYLLKQRSDMAQLAAYSGSISSSDSMDAINTAITGVVTQRLPGTGGSK